MKDEARWNDFPWLQGKIETLIRGICGILTALLRTTYVLITSIFHVFSSIFSLTIDLRLKNPHSNHVLQQQLLECLHEQRKLYLAILSHGFLPVVSILTLQSFQSHKQEHEQSPLASIVASTAKVVTSGSVSAPKRGIPDFTVGPSATDLRAANQNLPCPFPKAVSEMCWLFR